MQTAGCLASAMNEIGQHDQGDDEEEKYTFQGDTSLFIGFALICCLGCQHY